MRIVSDDTIAVLNIWMEARGESFEGKVAVAEVVRNRVKSGRYGGKTATEVALAPYQFSGWNTKDPNRTKALLLDDTDPQYVLCREAWEASKSSNLTGGATLYYNPRVIHPPPAWADPAKQTAVIGNHVFYTE